jgi:uncharacterized Zn-binding protein involved in type VI secretion
MPGACRLGDLHLNPADGCGCPACTHCVVGPAVTGSPNTNTNGRPSLRAATADNGVHCCCCGSNTWITDTGSSNVFINGYPASRFGDGNICCGGYGHMITASGDVFIN